MIRCLKTCSSSTDVKTDHRVLARGLLLQVTQPAFILLYKFLSEFLSQINIANKVCQSKSSNIPGVLSVIKECRDQISSLKDLYDVKKITHDFQVLREQCTVERRPVRKRAIPLGAIQAIFYMSVVHLELFKPSSLCP